jgi:DNA ligase 1
MQEFAATCETVAATTKKTEKIDCVANYFRSQVSASHDFHLEGGEAGQAAVFFSGRAFPAWEERTLQVGGNLLWRVLLAISAKDASVLTGAYRRYGDLGMAAQEILAETAPKARALSVAEVAERFEHLARISNTAQKLAVLSDLLQRATALEAKYIVKIITGDLRIGLRESLVEEAIAKAFDRPPAVVQRANMLLGDIRETLRLAVENKLGETHLRLFHPIGFMLATAAQDATEAFEYFDHALVEDKYDGIRAQAHCGGKNDPHVRLFSRTLDEITESFPELTPALTAFPEPLVLDGEILAWKAEQRNGSWTGRALAFSELQKRLGRKQVSAEMVSRTPTVYMVFDVLYAGGELLIDRPLADRKRILERLFASVPEGGFNTQYALEAQILQGNLIFEPSIAAGSGAPRVILAPVTRADSAEHLQEIFEQARLRGNEGLMVKDAQSPYMPGRRGKSWLKLKRELATLDVVVTSVEWGHGKRAKVLSDYTFAVRDGDRLLNVGKAYSGLTDAEIAEMTAWFLQNTMEDQGYRRTVKPEIVVEVAFNNVMKSDRHAGGFALRFPRIVRIRTDKPANQIDTLAAVREIYERQQRAAARRE